MHAALSAYNTGSPTSTGTVTTWADGSQLGYADSVMRHLARLESRDQFLGENNAATTAGGSLAQLASGVPLATNASTTTSASATPSGASALTGLQPAAMPQAPQIPSSTIASQPFRSFTSEYQDGGGAIADRADKAMSDALDPTQHDSDDNAS